MKKCAAKSLAKTVVKHEKAELADSKKAAKADKSLLSKAKKVIKK